MLERELIRTAITDIPSTSLIHKNHIHNQNYFWALLVLFKFSREPLIMLEPSGDSIHELRMVED